jgi:probable F420-dependent oxidoreductase
MDLGVCYFPTDYGIDMAELGRALEERGFKSLFVPEHTHIPLSRRTPFPGGGELPKRYSHTHDPFVALSFAAGATKKLKVGTGILLVPQHEPIVTAKAIASLDQLSGGRFIFGIGGGWNVDEMENHGATHATRFKMMREYVLAMKALWTEEKASFHGEFVKFDPAWSWPKPTQKPHPPILLGGETDQPYAAPDHRVLRRLAAASTRLRSGPGRRTAASHGLGEETRSGLALGDRLRRAAGCGRAAGLCKGRYRRCAAGDP